MPSLARSWVIVRLTQGLERIDPLTADAEWRAARGEHIDVWKRAQARKRAVRPLR
jgi:hypothetical protein